jgi:hypothetical protein
MMLILEMICMVMNQRNLPVAIFHGIHDKICPFDFAKVMD